MAKPFLPYNQQIQLLKSKHLSIEDESTAESALHCYGYFSLVTGYKDLLKNPTTKNYQDGATFQDLLAIYQFDEALRELTLRHLLHIERHIRSALSYAFCNIYGDSQSAYVSIQNYDISTARKNMEVTKLINRYLLPLLSRPSSYPYIEHHKSKHNNVPLWVLIKALTFGTVSKMYEYSNTRVQSSVSKEFDFIWEPQLRQILEVLTDFRNVCAHNERLFTHRCAKHDIPDLRLHQKLSIPKRGQEYIYGKRDYFSVVIAFRYLLPHTEFLAFKRNLTNLIDKLCVKTQKITETNLRDTMGLPENWKKITRYKRGWVTNMELEKRYQVDILAEQAGGYFSVPSEQDLNYTDLLFSVCEQFGIRYYSATPKERYFVEEVARVTWARQEEEATGIKAVICPTFA